jgi:hypothetical protein
MQIIDVSEEPLLSGYSEISLKFLAGYTGNIPG